MKIANLCAFVFLLAISSTSNAALIGCGSIERWAALGEATACVTGLGNPGISEINTGFASTTGWSSEGELTGDGSNGFLSASLSIGSWGSSNIAGNWGIDSSFWDSYDQAVISIHVGNGGGSPDYFAWLIGDGETSGVWFYMKHSGGGGGLSNIKLWGADHPVPEPAIIGLFGLGLLGIGFARRKKT